MSGKNLLWKRIFVVALLLLFMMMSSSVLAETFVGAGTPNDPLRKDGGIIGVTENCDVYLWSTFPVETGVQTIIQGRWASYNSGDLSISQVVGGDGSEQNPFHIFGSTSGLFCRAPANIATNFKIMYKNPQTSIWQDTPPADTQRQEGSAAVGTPGAALPPSALTTPTAAGVTLISVVEEAANCPRCKEIDNVWIKIRTTLRLAGDAGSKIWHKGWKRYDEVYPTPGAMGAATGIAVEGLCFPIERASFVKNLNNWGDDRDIGDRCHAGLDLQTTAPGRIVAIDGGTVTNIYGFTDCNDGQAMAVLIYHPALGGGVTINYGELNQGEIAVRVGDTVQRNQFLGEATNCRMLHLELYQGQVSSNQRWSVPAGASSIGDNKCAREFLNEKSPLLLDPTDLVSRLSFCDGGLAAGIGAAGTENAYDALITDAASVNDLEPALVKAIMKAESGFNPNEISPTGCSGLLQICGSSAQEQIQVQCPQQASPGPRQCDASTCRPGWLDDAPEVRWCDSCSSSSVSCAADDRFDPRKNIFSGVKTIKSKESARRYCGIECQIAAYNIGQGVIQRAAGGSSYGWDELYQRITPELLGEFKVYKSWSQEQRKEKIRNVGTYVDNVMADYQIYKAIPVS